MNDAEARKKASSVRENFWEHFERELEPKRCSKQGYLEDLVELSAEAATRIECVRDEMKAVSGSF